MKFHSWWKVGVVLVASGFLFGACSDDDSSSSKPKSSGSLVIATASGTDLDVQGIVWEEACFEQDTGVFVTAVMALGATGERTETQHSDVDCTVETGSDTFPLTVTNDGDNTSVGWENEDGTLATTPTGLSTTVTATQVTIGFTDETGASDSFMTLLFVDDGVSPRVLYFGNDEGPIMDLDGYPTGLLDSGASEQL